MILALTGRLLFIFIFRGNLLDFILSSLAGGFLERSTNRSIATRSPSSFAEFDMAMERLCELSTFLLVSALILLSKLEIWFLLFSGHAFPLFAYKPPNAHSFQCTLYTFQIIFLDHRSDSLLGDSLFIDICELVLDGTNLLLRWLQNLLHMLFEKGVRSHYSFGFELFHLFSSSAVNLAFLIFHICV